MPNLQILSVRPSFEKNGRLINSEVNLAWAQIIMAAIIERLIM